MYSVFFSRIELGMDFIKEDLQKIIKPNAKVALFPWAFPVEMTNEEFLNHYFEIGGRRYCKYINELQKIGIKEENITICNPYNDTRDTFKKIIRTSDILVLPGGNPEMFFKKVLHDTELIYDFKHFPGIVIGESAGTELQLTRYFITSKNNYYKYFAFYDGFGLIDNSFYLDVHTVEDDNYQLELQNCANDTNKRIYAIYDDGSILYNRKTNELKLYGNVKIIDPDNENK